MLEPCSWTRCCCPHGDVFSPVIEPERRPAPLMAAARREGAADRSSGPNRVEAFSVTFIGQNNSCF